MRPETREAIARIEIRDGDRVLSRGTGFLVTERLVLTALHVVGDRGKDPPVLFEQRYQVVLCFPGHVTPGRVLGEHRDRLADWAVVECAIPPKARPLPLADLDASGATWETYGFPDANPHDGMVQSGSVENHLGEIQGVAAMQLYSKQAAAGDGSPVRGLSGGPVIVDGAVVGILRYSLMKEGLNVAGTLYACPTSTVVERCGALLPLPDPCWGLPGLPWADLPAKPFRYLSWFTEADAELFFGRNREIRALYDALTSADTPPVLLLYGQSGVGKSSFLAAGVLPRLARDHDVVYARRDENAGLGGSLKTAIGASPDTPLAHAWNEREARDQRPLVVILDQVEEAFTRPDPQRRDELERFVQELATLVADPARRPAGRIVLSFRKEWYPEIAKALEAAALPHTGVFLERLGRDGVLEAITGLTRSARLRRRYGLTIAPELPAAIADDILADPDSPIAPTLQILLTKLWEEATAANPTHPRFDVELYHRLKRRGLLLGDFVAQQLALLAAREPAAVETGWTLDLLAYHTTPMLTVAERTEQELAHDYRHLAADLPRIVQALEGLFLLADSSADRRDGVAASRLAHDTLAPIVRRMYAGSDRPGQRARRILEARGAEWADGQAGTPLDERDLAQVEAGLGAMRDPHPDEQRLIDASRAERRRRQRHRRITRATLASLFVLAVATSIAAVALRQYADHQREAAVKQRRLVEIDHAAGQGWNRVRTDPEVGLVEVIDATARSLRETGTVSPQVQQALHTMTEEAREQNVFRHRAPVRGVAFSGDGTLVVAGDESGAIEIRRVDGRPVATISHRAPVTGVAVSAGRDGAIVSGSADGTVQLWDASGAALAPPWPSHRGGVSSVAVSRDGSLIASGGADGTVRLRRRDGRQVRVLAAGAAVRAVAVSPDGDWIASGAADGLVRIWRADTTQPVAVGRGHEGPVNAVTFTGDGRLVVTGGEDRMVRVWTRDGRRHRRAMSGHDAAVNSVAADATGDRIVTGDADGTVRRFDARGEQVAEPFYGPDGAVLSIAYAPDGRLAAIGSADGTMRLRDPRGTQIGPERAALGLPLSSVAFAPDGSRVAFGAADGGLRVVESGARRTLTALARRHGSHDGELTAIAVAGQGARLLTTGTDGTIRSWSWDGSAHGAPINAGVAMHALAVSRDGGLVAGGGADGSVRVWAADGTPRARLAADAVPVRAVAFHPDGRTIASGGADGTIRVRDVDGTEHAVLRAAHAGGVTALAFGTDGQRLASAGRDQRWVVWAWREGRALVATKGHNGAVSSLAIDRSGRVVATGGEDGVAVIWDARGRMLGSFTRHVAPVTAVALRGGDGDVLATATADGRVRLFRTHWRHWLTVACLRLRSHPLLVRPETTAARGARAVCEDHVWSRAGDTALSIDD